MGLRAARPASVARMERRKSDVSDLRKLTMAEFGNTRIRRNAGSFFVSTTPDYAWLHGGYACYRGENLDGGEAI